MCSDASADTGKYFAKLKIYKIFSKFGLNGLFSDVPSYRPSARIRLEYYNIGAWQGERGKFINFYHTHSKFTVFSIFCISNEENSPYRRSWKNLLNPSYHLIKLVPGSVSSAISLSG